MEYTKLKYINQYRSESINPAKTPDMVFEMYSVPIYETGHPEYLRGDEIASNKMVVKKNDILLCKINPRINRVWIVLDESDKQNIASSEWIIVRNNEYNPEFLAWYFRTPQFQKLMTSEVTGIGGSLTRAQPKSVAEYPVPVLDRIKQDKIVEILNRCKSIIDCREKELSVLNDLMRARFVELFGDLKSNSKGWKIVGFKECADIDTNMIHSFEGYENYPHIGIDSIEKDTGRLIGYRTIVEDGVISGKYLFTPAHIIYSKIRPNLNKVALPDFEGLCSADAYPILVKEGICNREYLGYTLRSKYFLDYILAFSNRTNLPKVNKNQVEGFILPLPPIEIQNLFSDFVHRIDKSKVVYANNLG